MENNKQHTYDILLGKIAVHLQPFFNSKRTIFIAYPGVNNPALLSYLKTYGDGIVGPTYDKKLPILSIGTKMTSAYSTKLKRLFKDCNVRYVKDIIRMVNHAKQNRIVVVDYREGTLEELAQHFNLIVLIMQRNLRKDLVMSLASNKSDFKPIFFTQENMEKWHQDLITEFRALDLENHIVAILGTNFEIIRIIKLDKEDEREDKILSSI